MFIVGYLLVQATYCTMHCERGVCLHFSINHIEDYTHRPFYSYWLVRLDTAVQLGGENDEDRRVRSTSDVIIMRQLLEFLSGIFISVTKSKLAAFGTIRHVPTDKGRKDKQRSGRSRLQSQFPQASVNCITTIEAKMPQFLQSCYIIRVSCDAFLNQVEMNDLSLYRASLDSYQDISSVTNWHI